MNRRGILKVAHETLQFESLHDVVGVKQEIDTAFGRLLCGTVLTGCGVYPVNNILRTIIDREGFTIGLFFGGVLFERSDHQGLFEYVGGKGYAFRYLLGGSADAVSSDDFYAFGFPYAVNASTMMQLDAGVIAYTTEARLWTALDPLGNITNGVVEDLRTYASPDHIMTDIGKLFDELIPGTLDDWERLRLTLVCAP